MASLSLDEYRLMMGTQIWLKETIFEFVETLLGGNGDSNSSYSNKNTSSGVDESLRKVTEQLEGKNTARRRSKISKINEEQADSSLKKDLSELRNKFEEMQKQTGKQKSVSDIDPEKQKVDLSNWSMLVHDNSAKRDQKQDLLASKLKHYKSNGYIS